MTTTAATAVLQTRATAAPVAKACATATPAAAPSKARAHADNAPTPSALGAEILSTLEKRWKHDARSLTLRVMEATIHRASQNIEDVLTLWDEDRVRWVEKAPFLLRMTKGDIVVCPMDDMHVAASFKHLDDALPFGAAGTAGSRLTWRSFGPCSYAVGRRVSSFAFGTSEAGLLTVIEARFEDGGRLALGAQGCGYAQARRRTNPPVRSSVRATPCLPWSLHLRSA